MNSTNLAEVRRRVEDRIHAWKIVVERQVETEGSVLAFGQRGDESVVLKVIREPGTEWRSGDILNAFAGNGVVRVLDYLDGAVLLERLRPGHSLVSMAMVGNDDLGRRGWLGRTRQRVDHVGQQYPPDAEGRG